MIIKVALPTPLAHLFDYLPPEGIDSKELIVGARILVPFRAKKMVGIICELTQKSSLPLTKLKRAHVCLDHEPIFPADLYALCLWAAEYYHDSLGEVFLNSLPSLLRKEKNVDREICVDDISVLSKNISASAENLAMVPTLNKDQQEAVNTICKVTDKFNVFLLDGVTGSGKTEVYLRVIQETIQQTKQVLILIPEINLTPQTIARFRARFKVPIVALHSGLSEKSRLQAWLAARAGIAQIVIGTRSAIFTPFNRLGLIVVDEEHDASFKQQDRFRYHARDLAIMRAHLNQIPIVLGSATPSLESMLNVKRQRYQTLSLPRRAGNAELPSYQLIDLRQENCSEGLSTSLAQAVKEHLHKGNQVMLFLNRRGFAPVLYCTHCHWIANCHYCAARVIYHTKPLRLQCHHCDSRYRIPVNCEQCGGNTLQAIGFGTQKLEQSLAKQFPDTPIIRVDRDNTRKKNAMEQLFAEIHAQKPAILLGTQMLAKGHHFPEVTLVGIIDADCGLFSADFRAAEQMGQMILQVAGRAGRADKPGIVLIQTYNPSHPLLKLLIEQGYSHFAKALLDERQQAELPPFSYLAVLRAEASSADKAQLFLNSIKQLNKHHDSSIRVLGPVPAILSKRKGLFCQHLLIKSNQRQTLQVFLSELMQKIAKLPLSYGIRWGLDVDPVSV